MYVFARISRRIYIDICRYVYGRKDVYRQVIIYMYQYRSTRRIEREISLSLYLIFLCSEILPCLSIDLSVSLLVYPVISSISIYSSSLSIYLFFSISTLLYLFFIFHLYLFFFSIYSSPYSLSLCTYLFSLSLLNP
ncbi:hypothetical protein CSUI_006218 [Cystoisospora suis]|uniref:Transmembrane protein n=1 Tax=Cystoisospora suis TaxID=483139 RepID=A0A2C6KHI6_9APIC|nr:hypothetical protein CSUI_006218 [Cystoisospora suis]